MAQMVFLSGFGCLARLVLIMAILCLFSQGQYFQITIPTTQLLKLHINTNISILIAIGNSGVMMQVPISLTNIIQESLSSVKTHFYYVWLKLNFLIRRNH